MSNFPPYRLALDIGTNSIGWACLRLEESPDGDGALLPVGFMEHEKCRGGGVCLFPDGREGKKKKTLNTERRGHRGRRKIFRARQWRLQQLRGLLTEKLALDEDELAFYIGAGASKERKAISIYQSRFIAASEPLSSSEQLAAVFLHMARHRYFQSNSLVEDDNDPDTNWKKNEAELIAKMVDRIDRHNQENGTAHPYTVGGYYHLRLDDYSARRHSDDGRPMNRAERRGMGIRRKTKTHAKIIDNRPPPATRRMIKEELKQIRQVQESAFADRLTAQDWEQIEEYILEQRPLKEQEPGECPFIQGEKRAPAALPSVAYWRILQTVNNLRLVHGNDSRSLKEEEIKTIVNHLCAVPSETNAALRKKVGVRGKFSIELNKGPQSKKIKGDPFAAALAAEDVLGQWWVELPFSERDKIVSEFIKYRSLYGRGDRDKAKQVLSDIAFLSKQEGGLGFSGPGDSEFVALTEIIRFKIDSDYVNACLKIVEGTTSHMKENPGMDFTTAVRKMGYIKESSKSKRYLPYYGNLMPHRVRPPDNKNKTAPSKYGMVNNVTVHVAMNQLRKLVNAIIDKYGAPAQVVVEMNRDMAKGAEERNAIRSAQDKGQDTNEAIREEIKAALGREHPQMGKAIMLYKCWKSQDERDIYDCTPDSKIALADLFSPAYELDHIVPRARGGIDKPWNLVVTKSALNAAKGDHTPDVAFADDWKQIEKRMQEYIPLQRKLAYLRNWQKASEGADGEVEVNMYLPRQETDAPYITKLALEYLSCICKDRWATNGYLTDAFRTNLGFRYVPGKKNLFKDRKDVRNHFLDAVIVGLIDRKRVKLWNTANARGSKGMVGRECFKQNIADMWPNYYSDIKSLYGRIIPARRQKHLMPASKKAAGALHQASHYSLWQYDGKNLVKIKGEQPTSADTIGGVKALLDIFKQSRVKTLRDIDKIVDTMPDEKIGSKLKERIIDIHRQGKGLRRACVDACLEFGVKIVERKSALDAFQDKKVKTLEDVDKIIEAMPDEKFGGKLKEKIVDIHRQGKDLKQSCTEACLEFGVTKIKQISSSPYILVPRGANGSTAAVESGNNDRVEVWQDEHGKWKAKIISSLDNARGITFKAPDNYHYVGCLRAGDYLRSNKDENLYCIKSLKNTQAGIKLMLWLPTYAFVRDAEFDRHKEFYKERKLSSRQGKAWSVKQLMDAKMYPLQVNILGELSRLPWSLRS